MTREGAVFMEEGSRVPKVSLALEQTVAGHSKRSRTQKHANERKKGAPRKGAKERNRAAQKSAKEAPLRKIADNQV